MVDMQGMEGQMIQYSSSNAGSKKMNGQVGSNQSDIYKVYLNYMPNNTNQPVAFTPNQNNGQ